MQVHRAQPQGSGTVVEARGPRCSALNIRYASCRPEAYICKNSAKEDLPEPYGPTIDHERSPLGRTIRTEGLKELMNAVGQNVAFERSEVSTVCFDVRRPVELLRDSEQQIIAHSASPRRGPRWPFLCASATGPRRGTEQLDRQDRVMVASPLGHGVK